MPEPLSVEELRHGEAAQETKYRIIAAEERRDEGVDFFRIVHGFTGAEGQSGREPLLEFAQDAVFVHAGIALDDEDGLVGAVSSHGLLQAGSNRVPTLNAGAFAVGDGHARKFVVVGFSHRLRSGSCSRSNHSAATSAALSPNSEATTRTLPHGVLAWRSM